MAERQIEMLWKCSSCGTRNLGRHMECQSCGNPKDGSEEWEMPADTAAAPTVTDPELLRMARGGPAWRCGHCGSDQRAADGSCASCGASRAEAEMPPLPPPAGGEPVLSTTLVPRRPWRRGHRKLGCLAMVLGPVLVVALLGVVFGRPRDVTARVEAVSWEHRVTVERYQLVAHEGFAEDRPEGALQVRPLGRREHHREDVLDHYRTEPYTERVEDGTTTERYTERVECGQTCTDRPQRCREKCTSNRNGFATCREECTGGGQSCTPRYCSESRTRQVPRYRNVTRTRQVPVYRSEPRYAPAFAWKAWEWAKDRELKAAGSTLETSWPDTAPKKPLAPGQQERATRAATYAVTLVVDGEREPRRFTVNPASEEELKRFAVGSPHKLRVQGDKVLAVDPPLEAEAPE